MHATPLICKVADTPAEFEQIHRLNYRTFVEEIPQHAPNGEGRLVDKFHAENTYLIVTSGDRLAGMLALRDQRPFSLDGKLGNIDPYLPSCVHPAEVRLLSVDPAFRGSAVLPLLLEKAFEQSRMRQWDMVVISATTRQLHLYAHLGFTPFGPLVGKDGAQFQPMFVRPNAVDAVLKALKKRAAPRPSCKIIGLLPGPVPVSARVRKAMADHPDSHRSANFQTVMERVRCSLCALAGARHCQVFPGSGTLANDMISLQLARLQSPGLVLVNGEFGRRIAAQAARAGMRFETLEIPWGAVFEWKAIERAIEQLPSGGWVWWVHHETSTGILNPLEKIVAAAKARALITAVDAISALGNTPVNLRDIDFASAVSSKGLCAYPGLGIVFHRQDIIEPLAHAPAYLDLGYWTTHEGVAFTHSSNLLGALDAALRTQNYPRRFQAIAQRAKFLRTRLKNSRFEVLTQADAHSCPAVLTLIPRSAPNAWETGCALEAAGYALSYRSDYLKSRNWLQIGLMGVPSQRLLSNLSRCLGVSSN